jgi:hypothetical protein
MRTVLVLIFINVCFFAKAQYPPAAGQAGTTAIPYDSSCFIDWAVSCNVVRGYVNIADTGIYASSSNYASYGSDADAIGIADNNVVSLGDGGVATLVFNTPISDGPGFDFAVFENSITDTFLELAFVEVSSDGINYFRIPSVSLTDTLTQTNGFGDTDPTKIHNLAGKYRAFFGTPFNIADIPDNPLLRKDSVVSVRIIDVVGSVNPNYASRDSEGRIINDPFPTPFASCGFDLDAVGVINNRNNTGINEYYSCLNVYPNPVSEILYLNTRDGEEVFVFSSNGFMIKKLYGSEKFINVSELDNGFYFIKTSKGRFSKFIVSH